MEDATAFHTYTPGIVQQKKGQTSPEVVATFLSHLRCLDVVVSVTLCTLWSHLRSGPFHLA
ncbi:hypothetical protein Bbelb_003360, partial [Branchiostoma belcheri]